VAVGWIQFIEFKCIDRSRNDLIEIASIGTVLRRFSRTPSAAQPALACSAAIAGNAPHKRSSAPRLSHYLSGGDIRRTSAVERPTEHDRHGEKAWSAGSHWRLLWRSPPWRASRPPPARATAGKRRAIVRRTWDTAEPRAGAAA